MILLTFFIFFMISLVFPDFTGVQSQLGYQILQEIISIIPSWLLVQNQNSVSIFDTTAQVLAAFVAIVFTISLFVIQMSSDKYTPKIKKYFKENLWTNRAFGLGLLTIIICLLFLMTDMNNYAANGIVFFLLILNCFFFYFYYTRMVKIINPYEIADILQEECTQSIVNHNFRDVKEILATISDVIIKSLKTNDEALTIKYSQTFIKIYYDLQESTITKKERIEVETFLFREIFRSLRYAIDNKESSRKFLIQIIFDAIQNEASRKGFVDENEIELIISTFLFDFNRYAVEKDDFELFKTGLHHITLSLVPSPRSLQNEMHAKLMADIPHILLNKRENSDRIFAEINCFVYLLNFLSVRNFSSTKMLIKILELYEKTLEKNLDRITQSQEKINELSKIFDTAPDEILRRVEIETNALIGGDKFDYFSNYKQLDVLFISLKTHFVFYRLGAFIIFEGKQGRINSATYLKELWDHTHPDDVDGIILNDSPVLFDPLWLTYIHFYGGRDVECWTKTSFGISWGYDDYHGAEDYLYQYYLLTVTRCIQKGNSKLELPQIEGLDLLKTTEYYKLMEWYEFTRIFQTESTFLLDHCDKMITQAQRWDLLFNNNAEEALIITKFWIKAYTKYCEELHQEIIKRIDSDPTKIENFSKLIIEEYHDIRAIDELTLITPVDENNKGEMIFSDILQPCAIRKEVFFKNDTSYPEHIFKELGRRIGLRERFHILSTILKENAIGSVKIENDNSLLIFNEIKKQTHGMRDQGFDPEIIFIPLDIMKDLVIDRIADTYGTIKFDDIILKVITSNNFWPFKEIVILDKSAGVWTFKTSELRKERITVEIAPYVQDDSKMKILVKTTVNYTIVKPDAVKIMKFDLGTATQSQ